MTSALVSTALGQALHVERLSNGTELVFVAQPLADVTTVVWSSVGDSELDSTNYVFSGDLTFAADLEAALGGDEGSLAPAVVVAVGGIPAAELQALVNRLLEGRIPADTPHIHTEKLVEGRLERRLGVPASEADIRMEVDLPSPSEPTRSAIEVLWGLLPDILSDELPGFRSRVEGNRGLFEVRTDPELAEMTVRRLRLEMARIAADPRIQPGQVETASLRLRVRRQGQLEQIPQGAQHLLQLWTQDGVDAISEFLFAAEGVTEESVRAAAQSWLPQHPGRTVIVLPPRVFNPRFAAPPEIIHLDNGLTAAILDRPAAELAAVNLRPVIVPDIDGELTVTILARLAREIRIGEGRPGWVRVNLRPPELEVAASVDRFGDLSEHLHSALVRVAADTRPVEGDGGNAQRRALDLMSAVLGISESSVISPDVLLRPSNIALGVVAGDGEAAAEALRKFWNSGDRSADASSLQVAPIPRTRVVAQGDESSLVVALELGMLRDEAFSLVVEELLSSRATHLFPEGTVEIMRPFVPGRRVLLLVISGEGPLADIESRASERWEELVAPTTEEELAIVRRRVAATNTASWSGTVGRARRCAAIAAGAAVWRASVDLEMQILSVTTELADSALGSFAELNDLDTTGAGILPISELDNP